MSDEQIRTRSPRPRSCGNCSASRCPACVAKEMPALDERHAGVHRGGSVPGDGDDGRGRLVRRGPQGRPAGFRPCALGYPSADPRVSRQSPLRRCSEPRRRGPASGCSSWYPASRRHCESTASPASRASRSCSSRALSTGAGPGSSPTSRCARCSATVARRSCARDLWQPERWPDPDAVRSPSKSIAGFAAEERRRESEVRREVEASYEPGGPVRRSQLREESA